MLCITSKSSEKSHFDNKITYNKQRVIFIRKNALMKYLIGGMGY